MITDDEEYVRDPELKTFHIQMLRKVAGAAEELPLLSGNISLDLDYPWAIELHLKFD